MKHNATPQPVVDAVRSDLKKRAELAKLAEQLKKYTLPAIAARHSIHLNTVRNIMERAK